MYLDPHILTHEGVRGPGQFNYLCQPQHRWTKFFQPIKIAARERREDEKGKAALDGMGGQEGECEGERELGLGEQGGEGKGGEELKGI